MNEKHEKLIADYLSGELDAAGKNEVEELIADGIIDFMEFRSLEKLHDDLEQIPVPKPPTELRDRFYGMLEEEKNRNAGRWKDKVTDAFNVFIDAFSMPRFAYTLVLLLIGGLAGSQLGGSPSEIDKLSNEVQKLREMMMVNLLEGASASDRLKAVNISSEFPSADTDAIRALLFTLNNDQSINVRVQAVEALKRWGDDERVRSGLVLAISKQESPIVIIELADAMIELELKNSADEFRKLLQERELDYSVQQKLENSIAVLM